MVYDNESNPSHSYGVTLAIWDHTVLPANNNMENFRLFFRDMAQKFDACFHKWRDFYTIVSHFTSERSFGALRRAKTALRWLRSTTTQNRLNRVMVCHGRCDKLMDLDVETLHIDNDTRQRILGK